jgi:hypothetical protein
MGPRRGEVAEEGEEVLRERAEGGEAKGSEQKGWRNAVTAAILLEAS